MRSKIVMSFALGVIVMILLGASFLTTQQILNNVLVEGGTKINTHLTTQQALNVVYNSSAAALNIWIDTLSVPTGRTATLVVAASNSSVLSKYQADYVCDGTDDQAEIQAAIDALPDEGGTVILMEGDYLIGSTIYINIDGLRITGMNIAATTLKLADGADCNIMQRDAAGENYWFVMQYLNFDGNKDNNTIGNGLECNRNRDILLFHCFFTRCCLYGVKLASVYNTNIIDCVFEHSVGGLNIESGSDFKMWGGKSIWNTSRGIYIKADRSSITNVYVAFNEKEGLWIETPTGVSVMGCNFYENSYDDIGTYNSIYVKNADHVKFIGNYIDGLNTAKHGIRIANDVDNVEIAHNSIINHTISAIDDSSLNANVYDQYSNHFQDCIVSAVAHIHAAITGTGAEQEITTAITNPDVPRNSSITSTNVGLPSGDVIIEGIDAKGNSVSDTLAINAGGITYGDVAFSTVSKIIIPATVPGTDNVQVGISDKLGLNNVIYATGDVYKVKVNNADKTGEFNMAVDVDTDYGTIDMSSLVAGAIGAGDDITIWFRSNLNIIE